jgi:hypothetical protein
MVMNWGEFSKACSDSSLHSYVTSFSSSMGQGVIAIKSYDLFQKKVRKFFYDLLQERRARRR